jgi:beta-galactosidase
MNEARRMDVTAEALGELERLILRDRNHPSIFMWSLGNEEFALQETNAAAQAAAVRVVTPMQELAHKLDPTRLCTVAMNNYWGLGFSTVVDVQGFNYRTRNIPPFRAQFPDQTAIGTETASTRTTRGIYTDDPERGYVAAYGENGVERAWVWWNYFATNAFTSGGFVWTGFDYRGEPTPYRWPCISSHFGLMDTCGFPKDLYYYYQSWWRNETVLHLAPHWNWPGREGSNILVRCFSNCDEVELLVNGKSMGRKAMPRNGYLDWNVAYAPGVLSARGFRSQRQIAERKIETTGVPFQIELMPDRKTIQADGEDVSVITVAVRDEQGRLVPVADNQIQFSIEGGRIIGVGNGDPSSHEADKADRRRVFNGLAQVIVQSTREPRSMRLTASSPGLKPDAVTIRAARAHLRGDDP